jgi:hypothetical protein
MNIFKRHKESLKSAAICVAFVASIYCAYNQGHKDGILKAKADEAIALMADIQTDMKALMASIDEREHDYHNNAIDELDFAKEFTPKNDMTIGLGGDGVFEAVLNGKLVTKGGLLNRELFNANTIGEKTASNGMLFYDLMLSTIYISVGMLPDEQLIKALPAIYAKKSA